MEFRELFRLSPDHVHLNNAGMAPLTTAAADKSRELTEALASLGAHAYPIVFSELDRARATFARFVGAEKSRVAFTANLSTAVSLVAWGLPFRAGDRVLTLDQEYASNAAVWHLAGRERGVRIETFASESDTTVNWGRFLDAIRPGVRAVTLSWVQFRAGVTAPLPDLAAACRRAGAWLIVDGIQGLGAMPFDLRSSGVDIVCGGSHKWMCGFTGHGFMAFRDDLFLEMTPILQGARTFDAPEGAWDPARPPVTDATRFEPGSPGHVATAATAASLDAFLDFGLERIRARNVEHRAHLFPALESLGLTMLGDRDHSRTSSIVAFSSPDVRRIADALKRERISHVVRGESLRLSPHAFNTREDLDRTVDAVRAALGTNA